MLQLVYKMHRLLCVHTLYSKKTLTQRVVSKIPSLICVYTFYNKTNKNTKALFQKAQSYMCTYPLQRRKPIHKLSLPKDTVSHVYILYKRNQTITQRLIAKIPRLTGANTHYNYLNINKKSRFPKWPVLHVYIPSTTMRSLTQRIVAKIPSLTWVHTLYNNTNINTNYCSHNSQSSMWTYPQLKQNRRACCQKFQFYMFTYPIQQPKHKHKIYLQKNSPTCVHTIYSNTNF